MDTSTIQFWRVFFFHELCALNKSFQDICLVGFVVSGTEMRLIGSLVFMAENIYEIVFHEATCCSVVSWYVL